MAMKRTKVTGPGLKPDSKYNDLLVAKLINTIMLDGKRLTAERIVYKAIDQLSARVEDVEPLEAVQTAIKNIAPLVEVKSKRVGGSNYQVPLEVTPKRAQTLALRWLAEAVRSRKGRPAHISLANELADAYKKEGAAVTKRENTHRMAEANKAFAHFAF